MTYYEAYNPSFQVHGLNTRTQFIVLNAVDNQDWHIMAPSFKAWAMPGQPGTFPLFGLFDQTLTDFLYVVATDGSTPQVTGYANKGIIAYVYPTQVCGSVPLYGASLPSTSNSDHWYTTDLAEKNLLVNVSGWADTGILAYVLPLNGTSMLTCPNFACFAEPAVVDCTCSS